VTSIQLTINKYHYRCWGETSNTSSSSVKMARRNTQRLRSNTGAKTKATSQLTRQLKEIHDWEEHEEISSPGSDDEYTDTPHPSSKSSSWLLERLNPVAWVPCCWCGIESTRCQPHRWPTLRCTRRFRGYRWQTSLELGHSYWKTSKIDNSHWTLADNCSKFATADLTENSDELLVGLLLIISVGG